MTKQEFKELKNGDILTLEGKNSQYVFHSFCKINGLATIYDDKKKRFTWFRSNVINCMNVIKQEVN